LPDQWNTLLKHSKITEEDATKNPQAVLDVLQFFTEQAKDDSGHFEVGDAEEQQKDWIGPLQQPKPKPKPSQSSPTPRRVKTPPIEAQPDKKKVVASNEQQTTPDENTLPVRFMIIYGNVTDEVVWYRIYNDPFSRAANEGVSINCSYTTSPT
jgi:P21-Rho-binding domain